MATLLRKLSPIASTISPSPGARFSLRPKGGLPRPGRSDHGSNAFDPLSVGKR
jgi:hypothetical protein